MIGPGRFLPDSGDWLPVVGAGFPAALPVRQHGDRGGTVSDRITSPLGDRPVVRTGFVRRVVANEIRVARRGYVHYLGSGATPDNGIGNSARELLEQLRNELLIEMREGG